MKRSALPLRASSRPLPPSDRGYRQSIIAHLDAGAPPRARPFVPTETLLLSVIVCRHSGRGWGFEEIGSVPRDPARSTLLKVPIILARTVAVLVLRRILPTLVPMCHTATERPCGCRRRLSKVALHARAPAAGRRQQKYAHAGGVNAQACRLVRTPAFAAAFGTTRSAPKVKPAAKPPT